MSQGDNASATQDDGFVSRQEFEAALMRQEHRLFRILLNFWRRHEYKKDDPRFQAVTEALVYRIAISLAPTATAGGAGLVAILGVVIAWRANHIAGQANHLINEQNILVQQQNEKIEAQNKFLALQDQKRTRQDSVREVHRLCAAWYTQIRTAYAARIDGKTEGRGQRPEIDPALYGYVHNRIILPDLLLHLKILRTDAKNHGFVTEVEQFLSYVTDYDFKKPDKQVKCADLIVAYGRCAQLDETLQHLTDEAAQVWVIP